ncbi:hypothetical protein [Hymenobacter radiodurans]|uniref:hypothetical protein n=1 Tax=Hymenobacter radiodurans TaxID=2496028 RepID=UPI001058A4B3|nr:hypothetical protein [Hymenobacter radiodurans]
MLKSLTLEELKNQVANFSAVQCDYYSEACVVLLEELNHLSGALLTVLGDNSTTFELLWTSKPLTAGWKAGAKLTENAATAIAFFLIVELTDYSIIEEAVIGTGVDYWLGYNKGHILYDEDNFMNARLEVSGIRKGDLNVSGRVRKKLKQTDASDSTNLPAYVVIVEFGSPVAVLVKK